MSIGALRQAFSLQKETLSSDGFGGMSSGWDEIASLWGEIVPFHEGVLRTSVFEKRVTHKVTVRARADLSISTGMRLVSLERVFLIHRVMADGKGQWVRLLVEEGGVLEG